MAVGDNSYGTAEGVASLAGIWTNAGSFDATTRPTISQVEGWIDNVSGLINTLLAKEGFAIPITDADVVLMLKAFIEPAVADICAYANGSGRFYSERFIDRGLSPIKVISSEFASWLDTNAIGLENLGATRTTSNLGAIGYRDTDNDGDEVEPLFTRGAFGSDNNSLG